MSHLSDFSIKQHQTVSGLMQPVGEGKKRNLGVHGNKPETTQLVPIILCLVPVPWWISKSENGSPLHKILKYLHIIYAHPSVHICRFLVILIQWECHDAMSILDCLQNNNRKKLTHVSIWSRFFPFTSLCVLKAGRSN